MNRSRRKSAPAPAAKVTGVKASKPKTAEKQAVPAVAKSVAPAKKKSGRR